MSILLGQLPPAEVARLKAELAETLIANFCYPRFFDYRSEALRMRPVDRTKRQDVWLYLSSVDFTSWSRLDLMSPDFQRHIERLFIHFVQRNRSFFGEQGRKRMADVRTLISSCAASVTEGLRSHLKGHEQHNPLFGSPRLISSWSATNASGHPDLTWEQVVSETMAIQQQLQELRGEIKVVSAGNAATGNDGRPATTRRSARSRSSGNSANSVAREAAAPTPNVALNKHAAQTNGRPSAPVTGPRSTGPLKSAQDSTSASPAPSAPLSHKVEPVVLPINVPLPPVSAVTEAPTAPVNTPDISEATSVPPLVPEQVQPPAAPSPVQTRSLSHTPRLPFQEVAALKFESTTVLVSDEDVVIFEQLRQQLVVWLRVEAVRSGIDISGQGAPQLLELLRQQESVDNTRLEVVAALLNIAEQVIASRHATLLDYKQGMMFYLMHTRRS